MKLFNSFAARAKNITWKPGGAPPDKSTLVIELAFDNELTWPLALSNSGNGLVYTVDYSLSADGSPSYAPTESSGIVEASKIHQAIAPGKTAEGKLVFSVPRGNYIFAVERKFGGRAIPGKRDEYLSLCRIRN